MQQPRCIGPSYRQETLPAAVPFLQHGVVFPDQIENVLARLVIGRETVLGPAAGREVPYQRQLDAAVEKSVVIGPIGLLERKKSAEFADDVHFVQRAGRAHSHGNLLGQRHLAPVGVP